MFSPIRSFLNSIAITLLIAHSAQAATLTVTSIEDSGAGSLRQILSMANDGDTINFSTGGNSITVYSQLQVNDDLTIDGGYSQVIGSNGTIAFASILYLTVSAAGSTIQNLSLIDANRGLDIYNGADNVQVLGCQIGTDWSDTDGVGNQVGIRVDNSDNVTIGAIGQGNVISANNTSGIYVNGATNLTIQSNYIGTNSSASAALTGQDIGIEIVTGSDITIGGDVLTGRANVISGNTSRGISIGSGAPNTSAIDIAGNIIGMNVTRTAALPNANGLTLYQYASDVEIGQPLANHINLIAGNTNYGIFLNGCSGNFIRNNLIGVTDANLPFGNGSAGVYLMNASDTEIGGRLHPAHYETNLISDNSDGVYLVGTSNGNTISGNFIGVDLTGNSALANGFGIRLGSGNANLIGGGGGTSLTARGNVISGNTMDGIRVFSGAYNSILGNIIGLAVDGVTAIPNNNGMTISGGSDCYIGSPQLDETNVISGNTQDGIYLSDVTRFVVSGNLFGTSLDGLTQISNGIHSIIAANTDDSWFGGLAPNAGNLFTDEFELSNDSDNNTVVANGFGVLLDGSPLPSPINTALNIRINSDSNWIGLPNGGISNYIANASAGIVMDGSSIYNGLFGNTMTGCSTPLNILPGGNQDKAAPTITSAFTTLVSGTSAPNDYIEVFKSDRAAGLPGGSNDILGYTTADGAGNWSLAVSGLIPGDTVTAIATDGANNSSGFAVNVTVLDLPTATPSITQTATITTTATPTPSFTITPTLTVSPVFTSTTTPTETPTSTQTPTSTISPTPTISPTNTVSPTISATASVTPTFTASPTATSSPTSTPTTSLDGVNLDGKFALAYPNPATNQVTFLFHLEQTATVKMVIFNFAGERVASLEQAYPAGQAQTLIWDCGDVAAGLYMVRILQDGNLKETQKVAIVR